MTNTTYADATQHREERPRSGEQQMAENTPWPLAGIHSRANDLTTSNGPMDPTRYLADWFSRAPVLSRAGDPLVRGGEPQALLVDSAHESDTTALTRVLVIDGDRGYCDALASVLRSEGFEMLVAPTGASALSSIAGSGAEMILLDLCLPDVSGTELCTQLRRLSDVPIIMVTSRSDEVDRIVSLEIGADDYVTKPYSPRELVARMRAVLRRWRRPATEQPAPTLTIGPVRLDVDQHLVTIADNAVRLPLKEFELLELLMRHSGRILTRRQIIERVWGADYVGDTKTLDTHIGRLRRRVEPVPSRPQHLVTVRGLGFRFQR